MPTTSLRIEPQSLPVSDWPGSSPAGSGARLSFGGRRFDDRGLGSAAGGGDEIRFAGRVGDDRRAYVFERRLGGGDALGGRVATGTSGAGLKRMVGRKVRVDRAPLQRRCRICARHGRHVRNRSVLEHGRLRGRDRRARSACPEAAGSGSAEKRSAGTLGARFRGSGIAAARGSGLPRMPASIVASRSTTWPSVPCTASSESWVRWTSRLIASASGFSMPPRGAAIR